MKKIFLDSDVLLDLLLDREQFVEEIAEIIEDALSLDITLCASPITVTNINYIVGKIENQEIAAIQRKKLLNIVQVENVGQSVINNASNSKFKDFEDAVQNYCAEEAGHLVIITRNTKDYKASNLLVLTPKEYLAKFKK